MLTERYMYAKERNSCLALLEDGFIESFEEAFPFRRILHPAMRFLKEAEKAKREGDLEKSDEERIKAGDELIDCRWIAKYFYKSFSKLSYKLLARLEERTGNLKEALNYLKRAFSPSEKDEELENHLFQIYKSLGSAYLGDEKELKYFTALLLLPDGSLQNKAAGYALLGKAMQKGNRYEDALQNFELALELSKKCEDVQGMCEGYLAVAEISQHRGDIEKSLQSLQECQKLAEKHSLALPNILASLSLGQLQTAKRNFEEARQLFEYSYKMADSDEMKNLCSVMCGVGRAHSTFPNLIKTFGRHDAALTLLRWRKTGGIFGRK